MDNKLTMAISEFPELMTADYLRSHPDVVFVFGDNLVRRGKGGAATLRDEPNAYGFITKKYPNNLDGSFYKPVEYKRVFNEELEKLTQFMLANPDKVLVISKLGAGLANRYHIYEEVIRDGIKHFQEIYYKRVALM